MLIKRSLIGATLATYLLASSGCGVLLYPERQGQTGGRLDPAILALNGIGLLFYVIPGLVAFAVDFHQGTIYLPPGRSSFNDAGESNDSLVAIPLHGDLSQENIEAQLQAHLGVPVRLDAPNVQAVHITPEQLAMLMPVAALNDSPQRSF